MLPLAPGVTDAVLAHALSQNTLCFRVLPWLLPSTARYVSFSWKPCLGCGRPMSDSETELAPLYVAPVPREWRSVSIRCCVCPPLVGECCRNDSCPTITADSYPYASTPNLHVTCGSLCWAVSLPFRAL